MPRGISTQVLGGFKTGMDRQTKRGGRDGAQRLYTLENAYLNERGDAVPRPGLQHVANVAHSSGLYGWQGQLHVFHGEADYVDPGNPLVVGHWVRYPLPPPPDLAITGAYPHGRSGTAYSVDLPITGSVEPYSNPRVTVGVLPSWATLSIAGSPGTYVLRLSGLPTVAASAVSFTVAVDSIDGQTAASAQSVAIADGAVSSLLHFDGTNGSTTFTDEVGHVWTPLNAAAISTAQKKFGSASGLFSGNAAVSTPYDPEFDLLGGAFTIECFVFHTAHGDHRIFTLGGTVFAANATTGYHLILTADIADRLVFSLSNGTAAPITMNSSSAPFLLNTWYHVAASVDASAARLYLNGALVAQVTSPAIVRPSGNPLPCIGRITAQGTGNDWVGNIDELRITKGVAKYNGPTITVPTAPFIYP